MTPQQSRKKPAKKIVKKEWFSGFFPLELFDAMKRHQMVSIGSIVIFLLVLSPIIIWLSYRPTSIQNPLIAVAKLNAFMAISTLSLNFFLSTRLTFFEKIFNGLDRMYRVHKAVGRTSLLFIIIHPLFLMISRYQHVDVIRSYVLPFGSFEIAAGVLSVYLFLILLSLTVAFTLPYHWWHNSHKLFGIVLLLAGFHAVVAGSDIGAYPLLRFWVIFLCTLGVVSWVYMLLLYKKIGPKYTTVVQKIDHFKDVTEIQFKKPLEFTYQPGQFIFVRFPRFEGYKELFPFSLSSDPSQKTLRISVKRTGDFTSQKMPHIKQGDTAILMGPYGTFGESYLKHDKDMLWIAGGIGITPFLSLAKHESKNLSGRTIVLIWAVKDKAEGFHDKELHAEAERNKQFRYIPWYSKERGRIDTSAVLNLIKNDLQLENVKILMCGPPPMIYGLSRGFRKRGVLYHNILFEDFNMLD